MTTGTLSANPTTAPAPPMEIGGKGYSFILTGARPPALLMKIRILQGFLSRCLLRCTTIFLALYTTNADGFHLLKWTASALCHAAGCHPIGRTDWFAWESLAVS